MVNPLRYTWTFWYDKPDPEMCLENWDQFLIRMGSFQTLENLIGLLDNIPPLAKLPVGSNFHLFKRGIEPKWEDSQNQEGGKWVLEIPKVEFSKFEKLWKKTIFLVIGTEFDEVESDFINGIVISIRKEQQKISIWTKFASDKKIQFCIGEKWKKVIQKERFKAPFLIEYLSHQYIFPKKFEKVKKFN